MAVNIIELINQVQKAGGTNADVDFLIKKAQEEGKQIQGIEQFKQIASWQKSLQVGVTPGQKIGGAATALLWGAAALGLAGLSQPRPQVVSKTPTMEGKMQTVGQANQTQNLANRLTQVSNVADEPLVWQWSQIISQYAKPSTSTYKDLLWQMQGIKTQYYNQDVQIWDKTMSYKKALSSIPVDNPERSLQLLEWLRSDLTDAKWKVKLWQEKFYQNLNQMITKFQEGRATLDDQTQIKWLINQYNKARTAAGAEKSGITPEWLRNVYNDIKSEIVTTAKNAGLNDVERINAGYHSLLETEPYIETMANKVLTSTAKELPKTGVQRVGGVIGDVVNVAAKKTWLLWLVKHAIGFIPESKGDVAIKIEKQMPQILEQLSKNLPKATVTALGDSLAVMPPVKWMEMKNGKLTESNKKTAMIDYIMEAITNPEKFQNEADKLREQQFKTKSWKTVWAGEVKWVTTLPTFKTELVPASKRVQTRAEPGNNTSKPKTLTEKEVQYIEDYEKRQQVEKYMQKTPNYKPLVEERNAYIKKYWSMKNLLKLLPSTK